MPGSNKIDISFRLDDPHAQSDRALESAILDLFGRYAVPLCVAVIPFHRRGALEPYVGASAANMPHVAEALRRGRVEIAQHGYAHLPVLGSVGEMPSEFVGVDGHAQRDLILAGRRQLEEGFGAEIYGFVPPWNTYDEKTVQVLAETGFRFISAGAAHRGHVGSRRKTDGVVAIPRTCTLRTLDGAINAALRFRSRSPAVVCVFHPDEFEEHRDPPAPGDAPPFTSLRSLERHLARVRSMPALSPRSMGELARDVGSDGKFMHVTDTWWFRHVPRRYRHRFPQSILLRRSLDLVSGVIGLN